MSEQPPRRYDVTPIVLEPMTHAEFFARWRVLSRSFAESARKRHKRDGGDR